MRDDGASDYRGSVTGGDLCSVENSPENSCPLKSPRSDYVTFLAPFTRRNQNPLAVAEALASAEASYLDIKRNW